MKTLTDLEMILLTTAAQRDSGSLLPVPNIISATAARTRKAVITLINEGLATEAVTIEKWASWREQDNTLYAAFITDAGRERIGVTALPAGRMAAAPVTGPTIPAPTKLSTVLLLLQREQGASLLELAEATGWQPHSTRAALTGLRKRGNAIVRASRDGVTVYSLPVA